VHGQVPVLRFGLAGGQDLAGYGGQVEGLPLVQACLPPRQHEQRVDDLLLLGTGRQDPFMRRGESFGGAGWPRSLITRNSRAIRAVP
jgi:hypothetical protein